MSLGIDSHFRSINQSSHDRCHLQEFLEPRALKTEIRSVFGSKTWAPELITAQNLSFLADWSADTAGYLAVPIFIRDFFLAPLDSPPWPKRRVLTMYVLLTEEPCGKMVGGEDFPVTSGICRMPDLPRLQRPCSDQPEISPVGYIFRPHSTPAHRPLTGSPIRNHGFAVSTQDDHSSLST